MRIAIIGYGKMGKTIERLALQNGDEIILKIDGSNQNELKAENLANADVAIEFSNPESAVENIKKCILAGTPIISGTTGWLDHKPEIDELTLQNNGAFLYASNFSIGVNIFFAVNEYLAGMMNSQKQYDIEMEEIHHTEKLDAPSGTGITLAEQIIKNLERKKTWVNEPAFEESEISLISKRIDKVPGTHSIVYNSPIDEIEIKHTAHSREGFALGAIEAARWIIGQRGVFGMKNVLGF